MPTKITDMVGTFLPTADDAMGYLFIADGRMPLMYISNDGVCRLANPIYPLDDYDTTVAFTTTPTMGGSLTADGEYSACYCYYDNFGKYYSKPSKFSGYAKIGASNNAIICSKMRRVIEEEAIYPPKLGALLTASYDLSVQYPYKTIFRNRDGEYGLAFPLEQRPFFADSATATAKAVLLPAATQSATLKDADAQMDVRQVVNVGAVPPPLFRYIRRVGNRLIGVDMPKYAISSMLLYSGATKTPQMTAAFSSTTEDITVDAGHGLVVNDVVRFLFPGTAPTHTTTTAFVQGTAYYVTSPITETTFRLSLTSGGAALDIKSNGTGAITYYVDGHSQLPYVLSKNITADAEIPAGFNAYTWNLKLVFDGQDREYDIKSIIYDYSQATDWLYIGLWGDVDLTAGGTSYDVSIIDKYAGNFYYSQNFSIPGGPFYWGDKITGGLNYEPHRLHPGDVVRGIGAIGEVGIIAGRYSSCWFIDITDHVDLSNWVKGTISGGTLSHDAFVEANGLLFTLGNDGPVYLEPVSKEDLSGGKQPRWLPADNNKCRKIFGAQDMTPIIDKDKPEYIHGCFDGQNTILWTFSTVGGDRDGDGQLMYNFISDQWTYIDGRCMLCLNTQAWGDRVYFIHGDVEGGIHTDFCCQYEANYSTIGKTSSAVPANRIAIKPAVHAKTTSAANTISSANATTDTLFPTAGLGLAGIRCYAVTKDANSNNFRVDINNYRYIISNTVDTLTFSTDRLWNTAGGVANAAPTYFAVGAMDAYVDTPVIESATEGIAIEKITARLERLSSASGQIEVSTYDAGKDTDSTSTEILGALYPSPSTTVMTTTELADVPSDGHNGQNVIVRARASLPGTRVGLKQVVVKYHEQDLR